MIQISAQDQVFVLTGAGMSAESGIPTFRGPGGLWEGHRVEEVASPQAWTRDPEMVWRFYSWRREVAAKCKPHAGHRAVAELESRLGNRFFLCTQNVDSLHEDAGTRRLLHMHGELFKSRCDRVGCSKPPFADRNSYPSRLQIPKCECGGFIRPHICWFGEVPFELEAVFGYLQRCSIFLCIGSSGVVEPAASFARQAQAVGARTFYVGPEAPANARLFDQHVVGSAADILPEWLNGQGTAGS